MNNPLHILQTLDRHLTKPAEITIFGRAALALGFPNSPATFATTHDVDAILPPDWLSRRMQVPVKLGMLSVFRPSTLDLILTKMARGDENDLADIHFLLQQESISTNQLRAAFTRARVPELAEIQELFLAAQLKVLTLISGR